LRMATVPSDTQRLRRLMHPPVVLPLLLQLARTVPCSGSIPLFQSIGLACCPERGSSVVVAVPKNQVFAFHASAVRCSVNTIARSSRAQCHLSAVQLRCYSPCVHPLRRRLRPVLVCLDKYANIWVGRYKGLVFGKPQQFVVAT